MTDFSVDFLGCKISQTDAESIRDALLEAGHSESQVGVVRVVNTCCITAEAEKKSRKRVRQLLAGGEDVRVFVTGCGATLRPGTYDDMGERVTALPGAAGLAAANVVRAADQLAGLGCKGVEPATSNVRRTRAFVKVQDGCNFHCSYCIVPTVRGDTRSRSTAAVLEDVRRRVAQGQREIVLTGINIGLYRDPGTRAGLHRLLLDVADVDGVARVRISSIESNHVDRRLVEAMAGHPKVCPHLHVPMQSGDDRVLTGMRRHYDSARYLRTIERARTAMPHLNLTTDIIVGFPTEDDAAFANTLRVARQAGFTKVHAFPFSARPGTDADVVSDPVAPQLKKQRSLALRKQAADFAQRHWQGRVGSHDEVIVERRGKGTGATLTHEQVPEREAASTLAAGTSAGGGLCGYTADYCPVRLEGVAAEGELVAIRIDRADALGLVATITRSGVIDADA